MIKTCTCSLLSATLITSSIWSSKWSLTITAVKQILLSRLRHPLRDRLTSSAVMLRMKEAPFRSLFVLRRVPNQQRWVQTSALSKTLTCTANNSSLSAPTGSFSSAERKKREPGHACEPQWSCVLLSAPQGLEMGTGPERQKHREEAGGGGEPPRTVPNTSRWGALMFDSWMIPRGDLPPPPAGTVWVQSDWML